MKRLFALIALLLFIGTYATSAQERHYSYRDKGTSYRAEGGGVTTMTNKSSSCKLPSSLTLSFLPDHKTVWLYSSSMSHIFAGIASIFFF